MTSVHVASVTFSSPWQPADIRHRQISPRRYPSEVFDKGLEGVVHLLLQLDDNGPVADAIAGQVDLVRIRLPRDIERAWTRLAEASIDAARGWRFDVAESTAGVLTRPAQLRVPVSFSIGTPATREGRWRPCLPGPRSWRHGRAMPAVAFNAAATASGVCLVDDHAPRLLTPLQG